MGDVVGLDCTYDALRDVVQMECRTSYTACDDTCSYSASAVVYAHSWMEAEMCFQRYVEQWVSRKDIKKIGCIPGMTYLPGERPNSFTSEAQDGT